MQNALWSAQGATSSTFSPSLSLTLNEGKKFAENMGNEARVLHKCPSCIGALKGRLLPERQSGIGNRIYRKREH